MKKWRIFVPKAMLEFISFQQCKEAGSGMSKLEGMYQSSRFLRLSYFSIGDVMLCLSAQPLMDL